MKRFSDTNRFSEPWYGDLPPEMKVAWEFLWANCDCAGAWEPNLKLADFQIGKKVDWVKFRELIASRISTLPNGMWWLRDFVKTQCGELSADCRAHLPVITKLRSHQLLHSDSLSIDYSMTTNSHKEQEQEKEEYKEKEKREGDARGRVRGTLAEVSDFCRELGLPQSDAESCFNKWEGNGWRNNGQPIKCWRSTIRSWKGAGYLPSQKNGSSGGIREDAMREKLKTKIITIGTHQP